MDQGTPLILVLHVFTVFQLISGQVDNSVRLADSGVRCSGRVEIFKNGEWGTVCDDLWDLDDAQVVCRQLGCGSATSALPRAEYGWGLGPIWLDDVQCLGNELSVTDCPHQGLGFHNCFHGEDASVRCEGDSGNTTLPGSPVRLVGSDSRCSGRVEVFKQGEWGTVCDDLWDLNDAQVVCQQIGCGNATSSPHHAAFGEGSGPIWLDNVQCSGNETSITDCRHSGVGLHNCGHGEDASVTCGGEFGTNPTSPSSLMSSPVRLVNSSEDICSGRVEVFFQGQWGTVCDDSWDMNDATVVCLQLGCGSAISSPHSARFGQGRGAIWLDNVRCQGNESSILDCEHSGVGSHNCGHEEDASVICSGDLVSLPSRTSPSSPVSMRLVGTRCSGRLEANYQGVWAAVCHDLWNMNDAQVVCRYLGCGRALARYPLHSQGSGPMSMYNVWCSGNESTVAECEQSGFGSSNCTGGLNITCEEGYLTAVLNTTLVSQVRLVNSSSRCSGRVEVFFNDQWGTVCDDSWDMNDANVVCQQLGCGSATLAPAGASFGSGGGPIWLDEVGCSGVESSVTECAHAELGSHDCGHWEDASVVCEGEIGNAILTTPTTLSISVRLVGSGSRCSGRLEVFVNDEWGTVCDDSWDMNDANVVCQQLGCGSAILSPLTETFGSAGGPVWLDEVECSGRESSIGECRHAEVGSHDCDHDEDVSIICEGDAGRYTTPASSQVRLVGSGSRCAGRVEVFLHSQWGTVCDDSWDTADAGVVCRQLGCGYPTSAPPTAWFGEGSGPIWLDDVQCQGTESSITACRHAGVGSHNCGHREDASVICEDDSGSPSSMDLTVRVVDSGNNCSGLVEVFYHGFWGTVCNDSWDMNDTQVVCRQLGCGRALHALSSDRTGVGRRQSVMSVVQCLGNESSISECPHIQHSGLHCSHVRVVCEDKRSILEASHVSCTRYSFQVGVPLVSLLSAGLNSSSGHMADPSCHSYSISFHTVWFRVSRRAGSCGTIWMPNSTHAIYFNSLYFYPEIAGSSTQPEVIPFSCAYPLEATTDMLAAMPETLPDGISALGPKPSAYMTLFRNVNFNESYDDGMVTLPPGSSLYVAVSVRQMETNWVVVLEDCYVTHTPESDGPVNYYLIRNKCPLDPARVSVMPNHFGGAAYFSAMPFSTLGSNPYIFLHCRVTLCDDSSNNCFPSCQRRRARRSVPSKTRLISLSVGPVTWAAA